MKKTAQATILEDLLTVTIVELYKMYYTRIGCQSQTFLQAFGTFCGQKPRLGRLPEGALFGLPEDIWPAMRDVPNISTNPGPNGRNIRLKVLICGPCVLGPVIGHSRRAQDKFCEKL